MKKPFISAIILAAGRSKRMGEPKQLLPLTQGTILEQTVDNYLNSNASEVVVVVGHRAPEMISLLTNRPVKVAINPDYHEGMSTSIITGLKSTSSKAGGFMLALADQPFVSSQTISCLIEAFRNNKKGIVIPVYQGKRGHPVIFASKYKAELIKLKGDIGGRQIPARHHDDILEITVDCNSVIIDIDTMDNYESEKNRIGK